MINSILIAIFLGALYLITSIVMYDLGRKTGRNEAELDNILQRMKDENDNDRA